MNNKLIVTLDLGSSSVRAMAVDLQGNVVARDSQSVETFRPKEGYAQLDGSAFLHQQIKVLENIMEQVAVQSVVSVAIASQRSTVFFWDKLTGESLAPALSWQDGRAPIPTAAAALGQEEIHRLTGLYLTPYYSAAKIHWALKQVPAVAQAARKNRLCVGPAASYLIWHLTQGKVFACDPTLAQRTLLFDIERMVWSDKLLQAFEIKKDWLPEIKPTCAAYGVWHYKGHNIPLRVCVGDQQAALYALHVLDGEACINYGSGAFFMRHTGKQCYSLPGMLTSVAASCSAEKYEYLLEGPLNACGTVFNWLEAIGIEAAQTQIDEMCGLSKHPILFLPALGGLGAPYWDFKLSPVMADFSARSTKADIVKGTIQALACLMADIVFYAQQHGMKNTVIKVSGGLAQSRALLQMQADILQIPLVFCEEKESTILGASLLAAVSESVSPVQWNLMQQTQQVAPKLSRTEAEKIYLKWQAFLNWCKMRY